MYSASVLDMVVFFCFLDDQLTNLSPKSCILPDDHVLSLMDLHPVWISPPWEYPPGIKASNIAGQARKETELVKDYILLPLWTADPPYSQDPKSSHIDGSKPSSDDGKKVDEDPRKESECNYQEKENNVNNTNNANAAGTNEVNVVG
ncbi:hypothetical protein Tco_1490341 [Tanacetum coccineum]